ncbi:MAG: glycosyltransferase [Alphaproteobacteria bacterium]
MARILYLSHDTVPATGGMRVIYAHVEVLRRHGFDAYVLHQKADFRPPGFPADVPVLKIRKSMTLLPGDVLVIPETYTALVDWARTRGVRHIIFCQNHFYGVSAMMTQDRGPNLGAETILCASRSIARFFRKHCGWRLPVVPCAIDVDLFRPAPKRLGIAFMPRKRAIEANLIQFMFRRRFPQHRDVPFVPIQGLPERRVAEILGRAEIFLSLGWFEGLGLAALEALAAEALVVGFHGGGGEEYANAENGTWIRDGDIDGCVAGLGKLLERVKAGDPDLARVRAAGRATAAAYSIEKRDAAILAFWRLMLSAPRELATLTASRPGAAAPAP